MSRADAIKQYEEFRLTLRSEGNQAIVEVNSPAGYDHAPVVLQRDEAFETLLRSAWRSATDAEQLGTQLF